ncbi:galactan 5-O-arabinofuranosyltransferase [Corynebacterium sp.]|uniref:galactan 5-O-arabinofuranosyltransferase n=1 Tax=Corynebacterium sp. TaxID=1720 RepID=UPI0026DB7AFF|nr:galactan 5-O-arabinofuranosyltransferase [Corynebacterium sp.]MDO5032578.1 galactan 5-O-arabinofuranosyltransferase [Corynebacterium sp.]
MTSPVDVRPQPIRTEEYDADTPSRRATLLGIAAAALGGGIVALVGFLAFKTVSLPAFSTSMVTRALSTVGTVGTVVLVGALCVWWLYDADKPRPAWRHWLTIALCYLSPALLTLATIGLPLSASHLWLDGVQVDQVFRTQFLTRSADAMSYADMNYEGLPTFYPLGWFWLGGRLANLLGMPGWEVFQPWSLISISAAGCILVPLWQRLVGSLPVATAIALTTTAVTLTLNAQEPYSAVVAMGVPAVAVLCSRAFHGSWWSTAAVTIYLGISACFYTLFTGAVALTVVSFIAVVSCFYEHRWAPLGRLVIMGVGSLAIAAIAWGPYILGVLRADFPVKSTAQHYLPEEGTLIPAPFLSLSLIGLLSILGLIYLIMRIEDRAVFSLAAALIGIYLWTVASMVVTLAGSTLLGFRLESVVTVIFATAGVLCLAELRLLGFETLYPSRLSASTNKRITACFAVLLGLSGIYYAQQIPEANEEGIDHAYTDTDGYGERADRFTSDSARNYQEIREFIDSHGYEANQTVVLTDEKLFMAYHPYFGFNAFTSNYANPLGQFNSRNDQIAAWARDSWEQTPQQFADALESSAWRGPDVIIFRGDLEEPGDGFKTHLAEDIYPNQPNVRYRAVFFNPEVFEEGWDTTQAGPFVVAVRSR